jgi:UDP:flavonoid glycosyltransferase YjiC (YdhE family)
LRRVVEALSALPVRAVLTLGPAIQPSEVPGSDNVVVVQTAPHAQLLRAGASLLVTHCGHGTTMKGLAAGVPLLCVPMGRDQNDTAARVVHAGAGLRLKPGATVEQLRKAIERLLAEPAFRTGAARLAQGIAAREGCLDAVERLEALCAGTDRAAA